MAYYKDFYVEDSNPLGREEINNTGRQLCKLKCRKGFLQKSIQELTKRGENPEKIKKLKQKIDSIDKKIILYKQYIQKEKNTKK